ncbi:MAG: LamG domain-containing protein [Myxococcota bacterium]
MSRLPTAGRGPARRRADPVGLLLFTTTLVLAFGQPGLGTAAPGAVLFSDRFESGFTQWSTTNANLSGINAMTASSTSRSLYVRGDPVATTSVAIDTRVPAVRVQAWIRRGSDSFSERPDSGEDLRIEYLDANGAWVLLSSWPGWGTAGQVLTLDETLSGSALHARFRLRIRLTEGSGGPPSNGGIGYDYWHVDDVLISELAASAGLALGRCEEFDSGLTGWTVEPGYGRARTTSQAVNSPTQSLAIHGGTVSVTSQAVDLGGLQDASLRFWLRRGADSFSEDPDWGEDLFVEYLDSAGRWRRLAAYPGDGRAGEILEPSFDLAGNARHPDFRVRFRMTGRDGPSFDYWHVDSVCLSTRSAIAEWRFEEGGWSGRTDEVVDDSGNARHATAYGGATTALLDPALDGDPGTCRHATFDGMKTGIARRSPTGLDQTGALTYAVWMQPHTATGTGHLMGTLTDSTSASRSQMSLQVQDGALIGRIVTHAGTQALKTALPALKTWTHVALVFDGTSLVLYQDAKVVARTDFAATTLVTGEREFGIGNLPERYDGSFTGYLDEARVYAAALDGSRIAAVMKETHDCTSLALRFVLTHDGAAAHCQPTTVRVRVVDPFGNPVTTYGGTIALDTQTGTGSWSLVRGDGGFADADTSDGRALYRFAANDRGEAAFALVYASGPSPIDVDVFDAAARDDDTEGLLAFAPSSFVFTAHAVPNPPPARLDDPLTTTTAGTAIPLHLTAFGGSAGGVSCGVIDAYDGDKRLRFWADAVDPAAAPLVPRVDGQPVASSRATAQPQLVHFSRGRATVALQYKDSGLLAVETVDLESAPEIHGSTGPFVSVPADLRVVAVTNAAGDANPGSARPEDPLFARAGDEFRVVVDAVDAEGDRTPSFGREAAPERILLRASTLVAPADGRNGSLGEGALENATDFAADPSAPGRFVGSRFAWDEVGAIRLQAAVADGDFLGAGPVLGGESDVVGRFAPHHFEVSANAPRFATGCAIGAFTWLGQPFGFDAGFEPELVVTAVAQGGSTTVNYDGDWFRIAPETLTGRAYRAGGIPVDEGGLPATSDDPVIENRGSGVARLRFSSGEGLALPRDTPIAPFDAEIELAIDIADLDGTAHPANPFRVGGTAAGTGIAFDVSKRFQLGRLRLDNAFGSELTPLPMRLRTQRFDGIAFDDDDTDSCSAVPASALVLTPAPATLPAAPEIAHVPLFAGDAGLRLEAPLAPGTVDVRVDLGAGGAGLPWLRADWPEDGNLDGVPDDDPRGRATFGIWEGRDAMIFQRELY